MSDSIKVGDQFKLPVRIGDRGAVIQDNGDRIDYSKLDLMVACIAINNHDRLVEENKQQRESLDAFKELVKAQTKTMSELVEENLALQQENEELRDALLGLIDCKGILTSDKGCVIRAKYLLNK